MALKAAGVNLRAEAGDQLQLTVEVGWKIAEMANEVYERIFGTRPQPERGTATPPLGPGAPIQSIFIEGIRAVRSAQEETATTLQDILNRL